eukprot:Awhi_evm1s2105
MAHRNMYTHTLLKSSNKYDKLRTHFLDLVVCGMSDKEGDTAEVWTDFSEGQNFSQEDFSSDFSSHFDETAASNNAATSNVDVEALCNLLKEGKSVSDFTQSIFDSLPVSDENDASTSDGSVKQNVDLSKFE